MTNAATRKPNVRVASSGGDTEARRDRVYRHLEEMIVSGELSPGERLDERLLAERFGVSRTPVREALNRLSSTGLVNDQGRQGATVATMSLTELLHTFEVMSELEGFSARLAAQRMDDSERAELFAIARKFDFGDDVPTLEDYTRLNEQFHQSIYVGAHNPALLELTRQVHRRVARYRRHSLAGRGRIALSAKEHFATAEAIYRGDADAAYSSMRYHMDIRRMEHSEFIAFIARLNDASNGKHRGRHGDPARSPS